MNVRMSGLIHGSSSLSVVSNGATSVGAAHAVATVARVRQLGQAVAARRHVRGDQCGGLARAPAAKDLKAVLAGRAQRLGVHPLDHGQRRRLLGEALQKARDRLARSLHLQQDATLVVAHPARERVLAGEAVDEGPEADALHDPLDARAHALACPRAHDGVFTATCS